MKRYIDRMQREENHVTKSTISLEVTGTRLGGRPNMMVRQTGRKVACASVTSGVIPDRREPYRRVPLGRVHLDERRLDEVQ